MMNRKGNTIFLAIIACLLWSTAYSSLKLGLQYDKPFHFAGVRFIISGLILIPFAGSPVIYLKTVRQHWKVIGMVSLFQIILNYSFFYTGMQFVPGSLGAVIAGSQPLITAIIASMVHDDDRLTGSKVITTICGISGVILITAGRQALRLGTAIELLGVVMILIANIAVSMGNIIVSMKGRGIDSRILTSASLFSGGLTLYLISIPAEGFSRGPFPSEYFFILLWLSFMAAAAFSIWFSLLERPGVKVSELNLWKFILPVAGAILSWILVPGEKPEWITVSGMVIIAGSLLLFFRNKKRVYAV
jgi:drug/metabolite transporter (DMT)-like permease